MKQNIFLVVNDYTPDAGSTIYGAYTSLDVAQKAVEILQDPEKSPYGDSPDMENLDIRSETLTDDPTYV